MSATLSAGIDSLALKIKTPMEADGVTPRDDLISVKVWFSTVNNFVPPAQGTLAYEGTGLDISIPGLVSGTTYYVRYALISEIQPEYYVLSSQLVGTPVYETQTVDTTPPPTPTGVQVTAGVNTIFIKHDNPTYTQGRGHRKTHVFGLKSSPAQALLGYTFANAAAQGEIGQFTGNIWNYSTDPATEWHIWLKWETNNGVLSTVASGGTGGNTATTAVDVSTLLTALTGEISSSELTSALSSSVGTIPNLNNQYVVKVNTSGQIAGFGLASTTTGSGNATSDFAVQADKFWVAPPAVSSSTAPSVNLYKGFIWVDTSVVPSITRYWTGTAWSLAPQTNIPFTVVTTPQVIEGQTVPVGVYMDAAFIKDATITDAKIGTAAITAAKIASVDATTITVNQLTASQINSNGLSIRDSAGNLLLDASNSQLGVSLFVGSGSNQRLLSTIGAYASVPNTAFIGDFASAPVFSAARTISSWARAAGITTVTTSVTHGFVVGSKVTITLSNATLNGTYEIIEVVSNTAFKVVNTGTNASGSTGTATGFLYAENSVYKNTADNNSYILTGAPLAWGLFLEKGYTPQLGEDYFQPAVFSISTSAAAFTKNTAGTVLPASIPLTTSFANITSPTYQWQKNGANIAGATSSTYSVLVADYSAVVTNTYKCIVTGTIGGVANSTREDSITIPLLLDGSSAIQVTNSNENITFTADTTGFAGISFVGGGSDIKAYIGTTALTYAASGANTFSATMAATGATVATGTGTGTIYSVPAPTAMSAETASTVVTVTIRNAANVATTVTTVISYSLSRKGVKPVLGADYYQSADFYISTSGAAFTKNAAGTISPASIPLSTGFANITSPTYQWQKNGVNIAGATSSTYSVLVADYSAVVTNTYKCIVTGTIGGVANSTLQDSITIPLLQDGASAIQVLNSNENITFTAEPTGFAGISFVGGGSDIKAYIGTTALTYAASGANTFSATMAATGATVATGTGTGTIYTVPAPTAMSAETAATVVTITIRDAASVATTVTTVITYSLSRKGTTGNPGAPGSPGSNGARGSAWAYLSGYTVWDASTESAVNTYFTNSYGTKVLNDTVTVYGTNFSQTRTWNGSSWIQVTVAIDGNLLVTGTVSGASIVGNSVTADKINSANLTIKDANGTTIFGSGTNLDYTRISAYDNLLSNIINLDWWKRVAAIPWPPNSGQNTLLSLPGDVGVAGVKGGSDTVWYAYENTYQAQAGGGWTTGISGLNPNKTYRFVVPVMVLNAANGGSVYWGTDSVCSLNTTTPIGNPYFIVRGRADMVNNRWYLMVGYIFPYGSANHSDAGAGMIDCTTGKFIQGGTNYNHTVTGASVHRAYQYYANFNAATLFGRPSINVVDGSEPGLQEYYTRGNFAALDQITTSNVSTYIASAAISEAYIGDLNASKITAGQLSADRINTNGLTIRDTSGNIILGSGTALSASYAAPGTVNSDLVPSINSAAGTALWTGVSGTGRPADNATVGATFGTNISGQITPTNVSTFIADLAVNTLQIAGNAVTTMNAIGGASDGSFSIYVSQWGVLSINIYAASFGDNSTPVGVYVDGVVRAWVLGQRYLDSVVSAGESGTDTYYYRYTNETQLLLLGMDAGWHTISVTTPGRSYTCVALLTLR